MDDQNSAQVENVDFAKMLEEYVSVAYYGALPDPEKRQALIDHVERLEARQITPEIVNLYRVWAESRTFPRHDPMIEASNAYSIITALGWLIDPDGTYERLNGHKRGEG